MFDHKSGKSNISWFPTNQIRAFRTYVWFSRLVIKHNFYATGPSYTKSLLFSILPCQCDVVLISIVWWTQIWRCVDDTGNYSEAKKKIDNMNWHIYKHMHRSKPRQRPIPHPGSFHCELFPGCILYASRTFLFEDITGCSFHKFMQKNKVNRNST